MDALAPARCPAPLGIDHLEIAAIGHLGWVHQLAAIGAYPDHWQSHDLSGIDILRASGGLDAMRTMAERQIKMYTLRNRRAVAWFRFSATLIHTVMATASSGAIDKASARHGHDDVLLNQRDELTLKALFATDCDVVLIWGGQHLLRIQVGIEAEGFELIDTTWKTVTRLPSTASLVWGLIRGR